MTQAQTSQIAITGAGIIGLLSAHTLAQNGHSVTLYDPLGFPAKNASFIAGGMLAPYAEIEHITTDLIAKGLRSIALWRALIPTLPHPVEFAQNGSFFVAHAQDKHMLDRFEAHLPSDAYQKQTAQALEPQLSEKFASGLFLPEEGHIHPKQAMEALCASLKAQDNVTLVQEATASQDLAEKFDYVIDARGYGAAPDDTELRGVKGEIALVRNKDFALKRPVRLMHPRYPLYIVPRADNIFMIGATQIESADDNHVAVRSGLELLSALYSLHPSFGDAEIIALECGIRPAYRDNLPKITQRDNIVCCNGMFRHGFLLAPVLAQEISALIEAQSKRSAA